MNVDDINEIFEGIEDDFLRPRHDRQMERDVDALLEGKLKVAHYRHSKHKIKNPSMQIDWGASLSEFPEPLKKRAEKEIMDFVYDGIEPSREVIYCLFAIIIKHNYTHGKEQGR